MQEDPTIAHGRQLIKEGKAKEAVLLYEQRIRDLNAQMFQGVTSSRNVLPVIIQQKGGASCLKQFVIGCGAFAVVAIIIFVLISSAVSSNKKKAEDQASDLNAGQGAVDNPIATGDWAKFEDGSVRATRMIRPANAQVEEFNTFNEDAPVGADYILLWVEMECKKDKCNPPIDIDLHLLDASGKEWGEPTFMVLDDDLDGQEVLRGSTIAGWQVFEYPSGEAIKALRITWGVVELHTQLPTS